MSEASIIADDGVVDKIFLIRGHKVMLDMHLAVLYGVETKQLKRAVRRNALRFPHDFMFELSASEMENLRRQTGASSWGGVRYAPMAFTEQGVAMLSSVLTSDRAILANIQIIRVFTRMRELVATNKEILGKLEQLENRMADHDDDIQRIFLCLKELLETPTQPARQIGFRQGGSKVKE